ncbi:MAG: hypothetical protein AB7U49_12530 [Hyphomicrobiaceae bacterium]
MTIKACGIGKGPLGMALRWDAETRGNKNHEKVINAPMRRRIGSASVSAIGSRPGPRHLGNQPPIPSEIISWTGPFLL